MAVVSGDYWVGIDPSEGTPKIEVVTGSSVDLAGRYRAEGFTALEIETRAFPPRTPLVVSNCVGMAKIVLGIRAPFALTPYRLYRHLVRMK